MRTLSTRSLLLVAATAGAPAWAATTWSVSEDFSPTQNPAGAWSYGYVIGDVAAASASAWRMFDQKLTADGYSFHSLAGTGLPSIGQANELNSFGVPVGGVILHPGNTAALAGHAAVLRWTAPADGRYRFEGRFIGVDTRGPQVALALVADGELVWSDGLSSTGAVRSFSASRTLDAGQSLWFAVANAAVYGDRQWTQLDATVSMVPEASPVLMLLAGLSALGLAGRRSVRH